MKRLLLAVVLLMAFQGNAKGLPPSVFLSLTEKILNHAQLFVFGEAEVKVKLKPVLKEKPKPVMPEEESPLKPKLLKIKTDGMWIVTE